MACFWDLMLSWHCCLPMLAQTLAQVEEEQQAERDAAAAKEAAKKQQSGGKAVAVSAEEKARQKVGGQVDGRAVLDGS